MPINSSISPAASDCLNTCPHLSIFRPLTMAPLFNQLALHLEKGLISSVTYVYCQRHAASKTQSTVGVFRSN